MFVTTYVRKRNDLAGRRYRGGRRRSAHATDMKTNREGRTADDSWCVATVVTYLWYYGSPHWYWILISYYFYFIFIVVLFIDESSNSTNKGIFKKLVELHFSICSLEVQTHYKSLQNKFTGTSIIIQNVIISMYIWIFRKSY